MKIDHKIFAWASAFVVVFAINTASAQYETSATNTGDNTTWAGTTLWDNPFGTASATAPGSNAGGAATDTVTFLRHEATGGTQTYRIASDVGQITSLEINGTNSTVADNVQLQIRNGAMLEVLGTTTLGANEQSSIILNQNGAATLALRGDIELATGATGAALNSVIENTSTTATLIIGGDINGYSTPGVANGGGIDLRTNSTGPVIFDTTGDGVTDTGAQTFNVDEFGVGHSGANNDFGVLTLGTGKVVNADDLQVGANFTNGATNATRNVSGDLTITDTTVTTFDDGIIGSITNTPSGAAVAATRGGEGTVNVNAGATLVIGDDLLLGNGAGSTPLANQTAEGTINVNGGGIVTVDDDLSLGGADNTMGTLNINDGSVTLTGGATGADFGNLFVGGNGNNGSDVNAVGVLDIGAAGNLTVGDGVAEQHIFIGRDGMGTVTSAGTVDVMNGDLRLGDSVAGPTGQTNTLNVTGGTFDVSEQVIVGMTAGNSGVINVTGGTFSSGEEIYLGGNANNDADAGSMGTLTIGPAGTVVVNDGAFTTNQNLEVGRDGTGILDVDGGTLNIHTGNLIVGQSNDVTNDSRGTVTFQNGATVNIGDTHVDGTDTDGVNNDFNFNAGGGDVIHSTGATVRVERDLNMQFSNAVAAVDNTSSYTISDNSTLEIGRDLDLRSNVGGSNTFTVVGGATDVDIGGNLDINVASSELVFDFDGTSDSIYDFNFDVDGNAAVGNATLTLNDAAGDLATFTGDILLVDVVGANNNEFANAAQGTVFGAYQIVYDYAPTTGGGNVGDVGGGTSIALIQAAVAVPEPGSLAFLGFCTVGALARRRRRD